MIKKMLPELLAEEYNRALAQQKRAWQRGCAKMERNAAFAARLDRFLTAASRPLGMCQERHGAHFSCWNKFSRRFAKFFYTECHCCLFYRGMTAGIALAGTVFAIYALAAVVFW